MLNHFALAQLPTRLRFRHAECSVTGQELVTAGADSGFGCEGKRWVTANLSQSRQRVLCPRRAELKCIEEVLNRDNGVLNRCAVLQQAGVIYPSSTLRRGESTRRSVAFWCNSVRSQFSAHQMQAFGVGVQFRVTTAFGARSVGASPAAVPFYGIDCGGLRGEGDRDG